ncbi:MAG: non-canonical purine NTP pyrophosphatase [Bacteroidetes bacterium HGW-Bacteroidetes-2]|jgi:XTP/dITP diphosphohydrolase|nr:MAG: non-canonical purine NTP pyrophosphatase [Bacteroidetes bacterium HGW-Bacteroidetes-2]
MKIVFATNNQNKINEVQAQLPKHITLLSLESIGCTEEIPETANTLEGNALQKALYVKQKYGYDCFADDTGLEVESLYGAPGVYSARYAGNQRNGEENIDKLLVKLDHKKNRNAQFKTVIALVFEEKEILFTGICQGEITTTRKGDKGFGYDAVFLPKGFSNTFAEMDLAQKNTIGHRGNAVRKLIAYFVQK